MDQGKDYGYEFPLPNSVKMREKERMEPVSVAATYSTTNENTETTTTNTTTAQQTSAAAQQTTTAQQTAPPAEQTTTAQNTQPMTQTPSTTQSTPAPMNDYNSANREAPGSMPHTSAGWLMMLLSGTSLSGAGMMLRRKR